jgi:glycosyltransferase involved in cell wall biosynthesis
MNRVSGGGNEKLKIALIAPPWLSITPRGYFGIENMLHYLTVGLRALGHHVELFTVGTSTSKATKRHWYHIENQYKHIHRPYYHTSSIIISHVLYALNKIKKDGGFDIIHDHNDFIGPAILACANGDFPPILHTIHEPFTNKKLLTKGIPDNRMMYEQFKTIKHMYFNCVSKRQVSEAPDRLKSRLLGFVYNGIDPDDYKFSAKKKDFFLSIGSIKRDKGQATAAKLCNRMGEKLKIAGIISGGITKPSQLKAALANPNNEYRNNEDFRYFVNEVLPELKPKLIEYVGVAMGNKKLRLLSKAKALLSPIEWEEPFGIVSIEALASGTPVITYSKGAMPEIIQHGVNGFLAKNKREFKQYMKRVGEIDPEACKQSVDNIFSSIVMATNYLKLYEKVIKKASYS